MKNSRNMQTAVLLMKRLNIHPEIVKWAFEKKGYTFFEKGIFNLNNFGIRFETEKNTFDDIIGVAYNEKDHTGSPKLKVFCSMGTTDPGSYYLNNPIAKDGTAILVPDQYLGIYEIGKHRGQYDALVQRGGKINVYRDNNKDDILDMDIESEKEGYFGINIHMSNPYNDIEYVNRYSAGCQVFQNYADFNTFMDIQYSAKRIFGNSFSYTLFEVEDFKGHESTENIFNRPKI